ncbi:MAG: hypothetical protein ACLTMP_07760 [Eggerthella lenta]
MGATRNGVPSRTQATGSSSAVTALVAIAAFLLFGLNTETTALPNYVMSFMPHCSSPACRTACSCCSPSSCASRSSAWWSSEEAASP